MNRLARMDRFALYVVLWAAAGALLASLLGGRGGLSVAAAAAVAFPLAAAYAFVGLSAWYVARSTPLSTSGAARLVATALGASALSSAAWVAMARGWIEVLARWMTVTPEFSDVAPTLFGFGMLLYLLSIAVAYVALAFEQARAAERRELEAQVLSREAQLRSLRAQIDPHFLFNSLHSISALTAADPAGARRMTVLLGDFFRESLALGASARIPLAGELALAGKYLEIERVRLGERLGVSITAGNVGDCLVPPLLLQPIVENAVKHGVAHMLDGGEVSVRASRAGERLTVVVENPADPERPRQPGTRLGLMNVRDRLRALYGAEAAITWSERDGAWRVEITLPATTIETP